MGPLDLRVQVRDGERRLTLAGVPGARVDAVVLAAHVLGVDGAEVHRLMVIGTAGLAPEVAAAFPSSYAALLDERATRVPLQHLTGEAHFRRLTLQVGPGVFVPRPETEVLVDLALAEVDRLTDLAAGRQGGIRAVDLCTGSGAIPLAIKDERPEVELRAVELSADALAWAGANRDRLGLDVLLEQGDARQPCFPDWAGSVDIVTINPPYIPSGAVPLDPEVRDHDPEMALYGGSEDGLAIPLAVAGTAAALLRPGGLMLMEHADSQGYSLPRRLSGDPRWSEIRDHHDLNGRPRVSSARRV